LLFQNIRYPSHTSQHQDFLKDSLELSNHHFKQIS